MRVSPLVSGSALASDQSAIFGVQNVSVNVTLRPASDARAIRQTNPQVTIGNVRYVNAPGQASAFSQTSFGATFVTPPPDYPLPEKSVVSYHEFAPLSFPTGIAIGQGATAVLRSGAFNLDTIPDYLAIYATPSVPQPADGDICCPIQQLSLTFMNSSGILSGYQARDLWRMSAKNGLQVSWPQYSGQVISPAAAQASSGAPVLLQMGKDVPLPSDLGLAPSVSGQFSLSVDATVLSQLPGAARAMTLWVVPIFSGYLTVARGQAQRTRGVLTSSEVVATSKMFKQPASMAQMQRMVGGSWRDWLASAASKAKHWYQLTKPVVSAAKGAMLASDHSGLQSAGQALGSLGYGAGVRSGAGSGRKHHVSHDPLAARYA